MVPSVLASVLLLGEGFPCLFGAVVVGDWLPDTLLSSAGMVS